MIWKEDTFHNFLKIFRLKELFEVIENHHIALQLNIIRDMIATAGYWALARFAVQIFRCLLRMY